MSANESGSAFPLMEPPYHMGMSLRDYFAGQALAGVFDDPRTVDLDMENIAKGCYNFADAMLKEREKKNG